VFFRIYPDQDEKDAENIIAQITQGGLGLTDRDYYLNDDQRSADLRAAYLEFLGKGLDMLGYNSGDVARYSSAIMEFETSLAGASMTGVERRDLIKTYNLMSLKELSSLAPQIDWQMYFDGIGAQVGMINVRQPDFFKTLGELWADTELEVLKVYMEWHLYRSHSGVLDTQWGDAAFAFYGTALNGTTQMQPRWRRVLRGIDNTMGEAVGREYVARHFPPEAKTRMAELVNNLKIATGQHIQELSWMTDATKAQALEKLAAMNVKIGYPDQWTDFSDLEIGTESHAANVMAGQKFQFSRDMATIGKPVDRSIWFMSPQTVNAYYSPSLNEIVFPAGILAPPFFWMDADDAVNYGGIGVVIAHEITHGFDDQGAKFDAAGNMVDWWAEEDAKHFQDLAARLVEQYNGYTMLDTVNINGELTLGENIADLGGLTISYDAFQLALAKNPTGELDGFTPDQRFFLGFAQIWRSTNRPEALMAQIKEDPHSPGRYRVIGTIVNFDPFYAAFSVESGQAHYLSPQERLIIW
jgi:putative endopeptidase